MSWTRIHIFRLFVIIVAVMACERAEEDLVLNREYLHVSDVLEHCQGDCNAFPAWEGAEVLVKGYIPDIADEDAMNVAYDQDRFFLHDGRNGMFMEIRIGGQKDAIFQVLAGARGIDEVFIRGTAESVIVNEGNECMKGVVVVLFSPQDLNINL